MAQTIKLRRSATPSAVPTTAQLALGELAINTYDGKLYMKKNVSGVETIVDITSGTTGGSSVTVSTTAPVSPSAGDLWWDSTNGLLKIYYNDGTSSQWVDAFTSGYPDVVPVSSGGTGLTSLTGGYIPFGNGTSALGSSANLAWSDTYKQLSIGGSSWVSAMMSVGGTTPTTSNFSEAFVVAPTLHAACTSGSHIMSWLYTEPATALTSHTHYMARQGTLGAGTTITDQYGYIASSTLTSATNNYGFYANIASGTGRWNFYANGTANNYFAGDTGVGAAPDGTQLLHIGAGTTAKAPIELTAGTNMTTVDPGSIEYDGTCLYFTPFGTSRGVVPGQQMVVLGATNTLTSQTGAQPLFDNASANGRVDLAIGTYWFECSFSLTSMSNTSGSFGFALAAGTAVIAAQGWRAWAVKAALATATNDQMTYNTAANTTLATAATGTTGHAFISGFVRITTAGTIVPQVSLGVASAAVVGVNSYFRIFPVSPTGTAATNLVIGNWS